MINQTEKKTYWLSHILKAKEDGLTAPSYCKKHGISTSCFYKWKQRLGYANKNFIKPKTSKFKKIDLQASLLEEQQQQPKLFKASHSPSLPDPKWTALFLKELLK